MSDPQATYDVPQKVTIEIEENLLILMIDAAIKKLQKDIENDNGKNENHSANLKKNYQKMLDLLENTH